MTDRTEPHDLPEGAGVPRGTLADRHDRYRKLPAAERRQMDGVPTSCEPPYARIGCGVLVIGLVLAYMMVAAVIWMLWGLFA